MRIFPSFHLTTRSASELSKVDSTYATPIDRSSLSATECQKTVIFLDGTKFDLTHHKRVWVFSATACPCSKIYPLGSMNHLPDRQTHFTHWTTHLGSHLWIKRLSNFQSHLSHVNYVVCYTSNKKETNHPKVSPIFPCLFWSHKQIVRWCPL